MHPMKPGERLVPASPDFVQMITNNCLGCMLGLYSNQPQLDQLIGRQEIHEEEAPILQAAIRKCNYCYEHEKEYIYSLIATYSCMWKEMPLRE